MLLILLACDAVPADSADTAADDLDRVITDYLVTTWADPEPLVAGQPSEFYEQVTDQDGVPIEDLQSNHERLVHNVFISADWTYFAHVHHEDYDDVTVEDLKSGTLHFPVNFPLGGEYLLSINYAHANQWLADEQHVEVGGAPSMLPSPDTTPSSQSTDGDVTGTLSWASAPAAGFAATWTVTLVDDSGADVTDIVQYLGSDAHAAMVNATLDWSAHTHAYVPGMDSMSPSMDMPHLYSGPFVDFQYVFPVGGAYKVWVQFARESQPGKVYALPFVFTVAG